jgi:predicted permease
MNSISILQTLSRDVRYAMRGLRRQPMFTAAALLTLAIGIGANTAIFSVIDGVLLKPLAFPRADQLVSISHKAPGLPGLDQIGCSPSMYFTYREQNRTFENLGLILQYGATVTGVGEPERVQTLLVTHGALDALGIPPLRGHWFSQAEDTPGSADTVILSYGYWQRRFGGDEGLLGRTITLDSQPHVVVGIMPPEFRFPLARYQSSDVEMILPMRPDRNSAGLAGFGPFGIARLKPGVTVQQANADVGRMLGIWLNQWPAPPAQRRLFDNARFAPDVHPLKQEVVGDIGTTLWVLMAMLGLVLLIACANVANLLLVRAEERQRELAIRAALGAGWRRIAQEMLIESLTLGVLGGALGLSLAYAAVRILVTKGSSSFVPEGPASLPRIEDIGINSSVSGFAVAVSLLSGLFFGLIPVLKYVGPRLADVLRSSGRSLSQSRERHRAHNTLAVVQVALALVLLTGSGLMIRTFQAMRDVQPGFTHPEEVQLFRVFVPPAEAGNPEHAARIESAMLDKLAAIPGVTSASFAASAPLEGFTGKSTFYAEGRSFAEDQVPPLRSVNAVAPGYFKTMGTPLLAGRDFTWMDAYGQRPVAIVAENLAKEWWGGAQAALGKRVRQTLQAPWREVVGVVRDVYDDGMQVRPPAIVYLPSQASSFPVFAIRTKQAGAQSFVRQAQQAIWSVDANLPIFFVRTLADLYHRSMARTAFTLVLLAIAGAMALLMGIIGLYSVMAYGVSRRTREIGIRMALGAEPAELRRMFLRQGLVLAAMGAGLGLLAAAGLTSLMKSLLFGVTALDPVTYIGVAAVLIAAAALASYVPARRATAVDPAHALRAD